MKRIEIFVLIMAAALFEWNSAAFAQVGLRGKPQPMRDVLPEAFTGEAIEEAINNVSNFGGKVSLPPGIYTVTRTMNLQRISPMTISGSAPGRLDGMWGKAGVTLVWRGPAGQPMIKISGHHVQWKNILFDGQDQAGIGVLLVNSPGWATSRTVFEDCVFGRFADACVQTAVDPNEGNNDFSSFVRCGLYNSGTGFVVNANQSVVHRFDDCDFGGLKTGIDVRYGGAINIVGGACTWTDVFIRVGRSGHNTGGINVVGVKIEAEGRTHKYMKLVESNKGEGDAVQITLDQVRMANTFNKDMPDIDAPIIDIGPRVSVTVRDSFFKQNGDWPIARVLGDKVGGESVLRIESSMLWGDLNKIKFNEYSRINIIDPMDNGGKRGPSYIRENAKP